MCKHKTSRRGVHWTPALMKLFVLYLCYDVMKIVYSNVGANRVRPHWWNFWFNGIYFDFFQKYVSCFERFAFNRVQCTRAGEHGSPLRDSNNFVTFIEVVCIINFQFLLGGRPMNAPTGLCEKLQCYARTWYVFLYYKLSTRIGNGGSPCGRTRFSPTKSYTTSITSHNLI